MGTYYILAVRIILSGLFAFLICRFYLKDMSIVNMSVLSVILLGLAYLFEYLRKRDKGGSNGI